MVATPCLSSPSSATASPAASMATSAAGRWRCRRGTSSRLATVHAAARQRKPFARAQSGVVEAIGFRPFDQRAHEVVQLRFKKHPIAKLLHMHNVGQCTSPRAGGVRRSALPSTVTLAPVGAM